MSLINWVPWKRQKENIPVRRREERGDPYLSNLQHNMDRWFDEIFEGFGMTPYRDWGVFDPRVDVVESDKEIKISAELPGLDEKDIEVALGNDVLVISGEKKSEHEKREENCYYMERSYGSFHREIPLPCNVDEEKIAATFKNGVLTVVLPKTEVSCESKRIKISRG
ncbi:MAG: Hsp20/alpha crystallin family protein [Anaerolineae bacterium]|nr:Hsp20/alpha crystallin family protein [Anaerolineae bacterium]